MKGVRPEVSVQAIREYFYVFGAVSPEDGCHDSLVMPFANTEAMSMFLDEVSRRHKDENILMFMDQAGWHKSKALKVPSNIELSYLPPYSPDLNPQEQVWDELREKFFSNRLFKTLDAVMNNAVIALQAIERAPEMIRSLTHREWILTPN
jgi:transposase